LWAGRFIHDNDVAGPQGRRQDLLDPGEEAFSVHWSVEKHWRDEAGQRQAADKSDGLPMTVWDCGAAPFAIARSAAKTRHVR